MTLAGVKTRDVSAARGSASLRETDAANGTYPHACSSPRSQLPCEPPANVGLRIHAPTEATGVASASSIIPAARVRIPFPDLRPRRDRVPCGSGGRYRCRTRKLTPAEEAAIRALVGTRSLRTLAADFGVSHETIRAVLRGRLAAAA